VEIGTLRGYDNKPRPLYQDSKLTTENRDMAVAPQNAISSSHLFGKQKLTESHRVQTCNYHHRRHYLCARV